jgi:hypothetical protein
MGRKRKIDRSMTVPAPTVDGGTGNDNATRARPGGSTNWVQFRDEYGYPGYIYDFNTLGLPDDMAELFATAFRQRCGSMSSGSIYNTWNVIRTFARFIRECPDICSVRDITTECINRYVAWLNQQTTLSGKPWSKANKYVYYIRVKNTINWAQHNNHQTLPSDLRLPTNPFPRKNASHETDEALADTTVEAIKDVCQREIDVAVRHFEWGQAVLARRPTPLPPLDGSLESLLWHMAAASDGSVCPTYAMCNQYGLSDYWLKRYGGLQKLKMYFHATLDTLFIFYLEIVRQTDGNADYIRQMPRDCLSEHPVDPSLTVVTWWKRRGGKTLTPQRRAFRTAKKNSAVDLIQKLDRMVEPYRHTVDHRVRCRLFLMPPSRTTTGGLVKRGSLAKRRGKFIRTNNISFFTFEQLRSTGGIRVYQRTGDVRLAQQALGHASVATTDQYISGALADEVNRNVIAHQQKAMVEWLEPREAERTDTAETDVAETPFGFGCRNPLEGVAKNSRPGEVCPNLLKCLTCPGAVVIKSARTLAKLYHTKEHLEACRETMRQDRWLGIYYPMYERVCAVIAQFPDGLNDDARGRMANLPPLPMME